MTVASEHGAAGDLVTPRVADALGVPFLDRALPASLANATVEPERPGGLVGTLARASTILAGEPVERVDLNEGHIRAELARVSGRGLDSRPAALHVLLTGDRLRRSRARSRSPSQER